MQLFSKVAQYIMYGSKGEIGIIVQMNIILCEIESEEPKVKIVVIM